MPATGGTRAPSSGARNGARKPVPMPTATTRSSEAEGVPGQGDATGAAQAAGQGERHERRGEADEDVAPAGGEGEVAGELAEAVQDHEDHAERPVELKRDDGRQRDAVRTASRAPCDSSRAAAATTSEPTAKNGMSGVR